MHSKDIDRILKIAQEDAERILRHAREDAERLLRHAQEDAERILRHAGEDAERLEPKETPIQTPNAVKRDKMYTIGEMSSRLAHDLQNPLTIIKNTLEILKLKNQDVDKKTKENYDRIERATSKMSQQIRDVLNFVRTSEPIMEKTSILEILKNTISGLDIPSDAKIILPERDTEVYGDAKQLEVVFSNLILNAIQASKNDGKIMIQTIETDNHTIIDVVDNGKGIEKQNLQKIFEPLFTTKQQGTGLGLSSCKSILESHGGTIECASIPDKGTVFTIHLPRY